MSHSVVPSLFSNRVPNLSTVVGHFDNLLFKTRKRVHSGVVTGYYSNDRLPLGRVLIFGKVSPFFMRKESSQFINHQSNWKTIAMSEVFASLGYKVDYYPTSGPPDAPDDLSPYDVVFGWNCRPQFTGVLGDLPDETLTILYTSEMHWEYQNSKEIERLRDVYQRRGVEIEPKRQVPECRCSNDVDAMIALGNDFTVASYEDYVRADLPVYTVPNAGFDFISPTFEDRDYESARRNFLWFGGSGVVLKGLDLVLEVFSELDDIHLYICGPTTANSDFVRAYETELFEADNIHNIGWVNIRSDEFDRISKRCAYLIYPSASEVAFPGAVINTMRRGIVPVATQTCIGEAGDWGCTLESTEIDTIRHTVRDLALQNPENIKQMSKRAFKKVDSDHSHTAYRRALTAALVDILRTADLHYHDSGTAEKTQPETMGG